MIDGDELVTVLTDVAELYQVDGSVLGQQTAGRQTSVSIRFIKLIIPSERRG
jgi:hypothetical protein